MSKPKSKRKNKPSGPQHFTGLSKRKEYQHLAEQLSRLIKAGVTIPEALRSINDDLRDKKLKAAVTIVAEAVEQGIPFATAASDTGLFTGYALSLLKLGEQSGQLSEHLVLVARRNRKERQFKSQLTSAIMYPVFVFGLTFIVGIGVAWFTLPKLSLVFSELDVDLPAITKFLIDLGLLLQNYGFLIIPGLILVIGGVFYLLFSAKKTKHIGQALILALPGTANLIRQVESARFGFVTGTLLSQSISIQVALESLATSTPVRRYQELYHSLAAGVAEGITFKELYGQLDTKKKLVPATTRQIVISAERSGQLAPALLSIGEYAEEQIETSAKQLSTLLEPVLLVIIWLGVVAVAVAVILPIYQLVGSLNVS